MGSSLSACSGNYYGFVAGYRRTAAAAQPFGRTPAGVGVSHNTVDRRTEVSGGECFSWFLLRSQLPVSKLGMGRERREMNMR